MDREVGAGPEKLAGQSAALCALHGSSQDALDFVVTEEVNAAWGDGSLDTAQRISRNEALALRPVEQCGHHRQRDANTCGRMGAAWRIPQADEVLGRNRLRRLRAERRQRPPQVFPRMRAIADEIFDFRSTVFAKESLDQRRDGQRRRWRLAEI